MNRLLVIGSLNMDTLIELSRAPEQGETVLGYGCMRQPGGKGANQAYAAGKLGGQVAMIGMVGSDDLGRLLKENLISVGVDISGVETAQDQPTGQAFVVLEQTGENRIMVIPGANSELYTSVIDLHTELFSSCDAVVLQLEIPMETVLYAAKKAKEKGKLVILDPAPAAGMLPDELLEFVDIIKPNETELEMISGMKVETYSDVIKAAETLLKKGVKVVVATRGKNGAIAVSKGYQEHFPAYKTPVVDTTAAGDSFTAAFSLHVSKDNFRQAVLYANRVASKVIQKKGAQASIPAKEEVSIDEM